MLLRMPICAKSVFDCSFSNPRKPCFLTMRMDLLFPVIKGADRRNDFNNNILEMFHLSPGAQVIRDEPNAGGNSVLSEVLSYEVIRRCFGAQFEYSEMQLEYWPVESKKTDYSVTIHKQRVGVSVTRAMNFLGDHLFTERDAEMLLRKKLNGVNLSSQNVVKRQKWERQILHIWTRSTSIVRHIEHAYRKLKSELRTNTIVVVTLAHVCDFLF